jgi:hypothetical protein
MKVTSQIVRNARRPVVSIVRELHKWLNPALARTLSDLSDDELDSALTRASLTREDLFTPNGAIAQHRFRMACMLTALGIKVEPTVREHWAALKEADHKCSKCTQTGRCLRWLEWGRPNTAPTVFCPNAPFFLSVAADQVDSRLRDSM